jgi:hypothetical protein
MAENMTKLYKPDEIYDLEIINKPLNDDQIKFMIFTLQEAIKQIGRDLQEIKIYVARDKKDQWRMISELGEKKNVRG